MNISKNRIAVVVSLMLTAFSTELLASATSIAITENGKARAAIIAPKQPLPLEVKAIKELVEHVKLVSGVDLPVLDIVPPGMVPIRLGTSADPKLEAQILQQGDNPSAFALVVKDDEILIRGLSDEGTLFGVYELLEQIGVRWYMPGEIGRVIPSSPSIHLQKQQTIQIPSMDFRILQDYRVGDWKTRVRMGGDKHTTGAHGIEPFIIGRKQIAALFESHPEYFSLVGGKRTTQQICLSNPQVYELVRKTLLEQLKKENPDISKSHYVGMAPNDGHGYCECTGCKALDGTVHDQLFSEISTTDRYVRFINRLLEDTKQAYPNLHIVFYAYSLHTFAPNSVTPDKRLVPIFAPITLDRIRGMDNPMSPERYIFRTIIEGWSKFNCDEMWYRGYYNNLGCPQFPISQIDRVQNEIPVLRQKGINGMRVEVIQQSWASTPLTLYVASKMMWNVKTDVDALLAEFYPKFYGPAAKPMQAYHEAVEAAFRDTPYFTGSSYPYLQIYDQNRRDKIRGFLTNAAKLAATGKDEKYIERVRINQLGFERLELFLDMIAARNRFDFAAANDKLQQYNQLTDQMVNYVIEDGKLPPKTTELDLHRLVCWRERSTNKSAMFNRFFSPAVTSGYSRVEKDGDFIAGLPDTWNFLIDPTDIGEISGWQRPGLIGGNWQPLKTFSATWSDQGLNYYKGIAWYRTQFSIPKKFQGRKIYLWFGGVDERAKVWVNGKLLGTSDKPEDGLPGVPGSFMPFDMNATDAVQFGKENTIVVRIVNRQLNELGTGGIIAPVMFWSPKHPKGEK